MVITDTGFWLALLDREDRFHQVAVKATKEIKEGYITTWPVLTEVTHILLQRFGSFVELSFLSSILEGGAEIFELNSDSYARILTLCRKYRDLPMDLADASLIIVAESLGDGRILTTDLRDFKSYRWKNHKPFRNLLIE